MIADKGHGRQSRAEEQVESLVLALCERLAEVLPADKFEVTVEHGKAVRILGKGARYGNSLWLTPIAIWRSQLPVEQRLQLFLDQASRRVQTFVSDRHRRWPTMTAKPWVSIGEDWILVWWGGESKKDAVVALRPIARDELGI
jgi:hypothetical protein